MDKSRFQFGHCHSKIAKHLFLKILKTIFEEFTNSILHTLDLNHFKSIPASQFWIMHFLMESNMINIVVVQLRKPRNANLIVYLENGEGANLLLVYFSQLFFPLTVSLLQFLSTITNRTFYCFSLIIRGNYHSILCVKLWRAYQAQYFDHLCQTIVKIQGY